MDENKLYAVFAYIAAREGVCVEEIVKEIEDTIEEAFLSLQAAKEETTLALWENIPRKGKIPTAAEFVAYLCDRIMTE